MMKLPMRGALLLCLIVFLNGCAAPAPPPIDRSVPGNLTQATPEPLMQSADNGGLLYWALELRCALRQSNSDKAAIRAWSDRVPYLGAASCK